MHNILIISIEGKNIRTEEIYFTNKNNPYESSFKRDRHLLSRLNINDLFFFSVNIYASEKKFLKELMIIEKVKPVISECYFLCDNDFESYKDDQVKKQISNFSMILIKKWNFIKQNKIFYLKYKETNQKFENFLECHFMNRKLYKNYHKSDKKIYARTMGRNGQNLQILINNFHYIDKNRSFYHLFSIRKDTQYEQ